jgi:hypothetical protein
VFSENKFLDPEISASASPAQQFLKYNGPHLLVGPQRQSFRLNRLEDYSYCAFTLLVKTFRKRQFSSPSFFCDISPICGQLLPSSAASKVPFQGSGGRGAYNHWINGD